MTSTRIDGLRLVAPPPLPGLPSDRVSQLAGVGTEIDTSFRLLPYLPLRARWVARITEFEWNHHFADVQVKGPFRIWHHRHEMASEARNGVEGTVVRDRIECEPRFGIFGEVGTRAVLSTQMTSTFGYRQRALPQLLAAS